MFDYQKMFKTKEKKYTLSFTAPRELDEKLELIAKEQKCHKSTVICELIEHFDYEFFKNHFKCTSCNNLFKKEYEDQWMCYECCERASENE